MRPTATLLRRWGVFGGRSRRRGPRHTVERDAREIRSAESNVTRHDGSEWAWTSRLDDRNVVLRLFGVLMVGATAVGTYYSAHLETVPVTNRSRFVGPQPLQDRVRGEMAVERRVRLAGGAALPSSDPLVNYVGTIGTRLAEAIPETFGTRKRPWSFLVLDGDDREVRAYANLSGGGTVVVYTGALPVLRNEHAVAAVMAHEMTHVVCRHQAEVVAGLSLRFALVRILHLVADCSRWLDDLLAEADAKPLTADAEREASQLGLLLVARSCFDPAAVGTTFQRLFRPVEWLNEEQVDFDLSDSATFHADSAGGDDGAWSGVTVTEDRPARPTATSDTAMAGSWAKTHGTISADDRSSVLAVHRDDAQRLAQASNCSRDYGSFRSVLDGRLDLFGREDEAAEMQAFADAQGTRDEAASGAWDAATEKKLRDSLRDER